MDLKTKIFIAFIILAIFALMAFIIKSQNDSINSLKQITATQENQQKYLEDNISRIQSTLVSKDEFNKKLDNLGMDLSAVKADLKSIGAAANGIISLQTSTIGLIKQNIPSTGTEPLPPTTENLSCEEVGCVKDKYSYFKNQPYLNLTEPYTGGTIPFGKVYFNATSKDPWSINVYPRNYSANIILASDQYNKKTAYAKFFIEPQDGNNKVYDLPQVKITYTEQLPENKFSWWNPRFMGSFDLGPSFDKANIYLSMPVGVQFYLSSYGQMMYDPKFYFLGFGAGFNFRGQDNPLVFTFTPFAYKITGEDSFFRNLYVGPTLGGDLNNKLFVMGGFKVAL